MPREATAPTQLTMTVLAALWVSLETGDSAAAGDPRCDNGKLSLRRDLPEDGDLWRCPESKWVEHEQWHFGVDKIFRPEPTKQICMDQPISYQQQIPHSGAFRPVAAARGEYLYCPPQRWLNNLHRGSTILLYHPCAPEAERRRLSALARSCLPDFVLTSHPKLRKGMPLALVSWGRVLELSTALSADICHWLEATVNLREVVEGPECEYNLLLTWSSWQRDRSNAAVTTKESLWQCCERTVSSLRADLNSPMKDANTTHKSERRRRAAVRYEAQRENATKISNPSTGLVNKTSIRSPPTAAPPLQGVVRSDIVAGQGKPAVQIHSQNRSHTSVMIPPRAPSGESVEVKQREANNTHAPKTTQQRRKELPGTPRTDEAVWAAAALGFLLVLLTLSVLHTRLYRHWRAPPSLYWHDPRQDYDSVADIIRRRLRIAQRRRKRGRRQECVLLPSSSSSDEHL